MPYYDVDEEVIAALASSLRVCSACACACVRAYAHGCIASHRIASHCLGLDWIARLASSRPTAKPTSRFRACSSESLPSMPPCVAKQQDKKHPLKTFERPKQTRTGPYRVSTHMGYSEYSHPHRTLPSADKRGDAHAFGRQWLCRRVRVCACAGVGG